MAILDLKPENQIIANKVIRHAMDNQLDFAAEVLLQHFETDDGCPVPNEIKEYLTFVLGEETLDKIFTNIYNNIF